MIEKKTMKSIMKLVLGTSFEDKKKVEAISDNKVPQSTHRTSIPSRKSKRSVQKTKMGCG